MYGPAFLTVPCSWLYGMAVAIRHKLFDWGAIKSVEFDIPVICVGNITVGGTGKTPFTEFLIRALREQYSIGVVSLGYKRSTKGFVLAAPDSSYHDIGDEPKQIKTKFPDVQVAVCKKRVEGINELRRLHPEINLIILDDAFQHRQAEAWVNIVLMDYNRQIYTDHLLPWGQLRDLPSQMKRAQIVVVTKVPDTAKPIDIRVTTKALDLFPYQKVFFSRMSEPAPQPLFPDYGQGPLAPGQHVIALSGIATPARFNERLAREYTVVREFNYPDHHAYKMSDVKEVIAALKQSPRDTVVVVTEKDAVKLTNRRKIPVGLLKRLYYAPVGIEFLKECEGQVFLTHLQEYVRKNYKYHPLHP